MKMRVDKILIEQEKERAFKKAVEIYRRNPAIFWAIKWLRKKLSLRKVVDYVRENMSDAVISTSNVQAWNKDVEYIVRGNTLFRDFMVAVWIDPDENNRLDLNARKSKLAKKHAKTQKEKDQKLKEEMDKAKIILSEMMWENLPETKKWELSSRGRRQVEAINRSIQEWWVPKTNWVTELYDINTKILAKWKEIILDKLWKINPKNTRDLKAMEDIMDSAFKQNRLIEGKSTDNIAVWVHDIYDRIIQNANERKIQEKNKED